MIPLNSQPASWLTHPERPDLAYNHIIGCWVLFTAQADMRLLACLYTNPDLARKHALELGAIINYGEVTFEVRAAEARERAA